MKSRQLLIFHFSSEENKYIKKKKDEEEKYSSKAYRFPDLVNGSDVSVKDRFGNVFEGYRSIKLNPALSV